ncbi:MAG: cytochrome c [Rhizobacter sp.]
MTRKPRSVASCCLPALLVLAGCSRMSTDSADANARELLARHHCGSCHVIPGVPAAQGRVAVSLEHFGRRSYIAGRIPNDDAQLARWLMDPASLVPGTTMPAMGVSADDAQVMAAYLRRQR